MEVGHWPLSPGDLGIPCLLYPPQEWTGLPISVAEVSPSLPCSFPSISKLCSGRGNHNCQTHAGMVKRHLKTVNYKSLFICSASVKVRTLASKMKSKGKEDHACRLTETSALLKPVACGPAAPCCWLSIPLDTCQQFFAFPLVNQTPSTHYHCQSSQYFWAVSASSSRCTEETEARELSQQYYRY